MLLQASNRESAGSTDLPGAGCRQAGVGTRGSRQLDAALKVAEQLKRPILRMPDKEELAAMDRLVMEVASPRTKRTLIDYRNDNKVRGARCEVVRSKLCKGTCFLALL